ncbi:hypothetical protein [Mucilaginibacter sp. SP1R1]|uniref:hypothetical protein n=1 Tax=Mucilaginibacter sp. SP1R1 TaxID=2723091 RepID=UPI0016151A10|nr:hypothetical protein [Mucilaginibacter sp. SP1R1]MBB6149195.1 hypothetical protein [Mucilaginibacter sp. SP1R1]
MLPDIEQLKANYKGLSDDKLTRLAVSEAASLRPEALDLLKAEIKSRGLDKGIINGINVQLSEVDDYHLENYLYIIRNQQCPVCGDTHQQLNAAVNGTVMSFILITHYKKKMLIACPPCLQKANKKATLTTALLGWWGFPWGIIRSVQALVRNTKSGKQVKYNNPTDALTSFVKNNIGVIESMRDNAASLQLMLSNINNRQ